MDDPLAVTEHLAIPRGELRWRFSRSSGPGGQSVNTTDSRVELRFDVAGSPSLSRTAKERALPRLEGRLVDGAIVVTAEEHRSQWQNRRAAEQRLVEILAAALAPPPRPRRATRPSRGAVQRRLDAKKRRSDLKRQRRPDAD